ncbi:DUF1127 domain-containing protein [Hwanghaeella sp.]|uniref:DUF1127 domain-containing protein n=1 Tax=Hwanghaeella sp. TaxID=2605943 RepID=UPI003CCBF410
MIVWTAKALRKWWIRRTRQNELSALDDRTLKDIGILRPEIPLVVELQIERPVPARRKPLFRTRQPTAGPAQACIAVEGKSELAA